MVRSLLAASLGLAALPGAEGVLSLLRSHASAQDADPCACRNWKETYASAGVQCGLTNEYFFVTKRHLLLPQEIKSLDGLKAEFCTHFFEAIDDNFCINMNMGNDRGQWCYVDAACPDLGDGEKVNDQVAWKTCSPQKDRMLRQYDPVALTKLAAEKNLELGLFNKMAYPMSEYKWKYVSSFWGATMDELTALPADFPVPNVTLAEVKDFLRPRWGKRNRDIDAEMSAELVKISQSGVPTTFDTARDQHPPHVIVQGRTVYCVLPVAQPTLLCIYGCPH